jgi:hypothetical protein
VLRQGLLNICVLIILLISTKVPHAQSIVDQWQFYNATTKPNKKITALKNILILNDNKDPYFADSVAKNAVNICRLNGLQDSLLEIYKVYFNTVQESSDSMMLSQYYTIAHAKGSDFYKCYANIAMANYYRNMNQLQRASVYALEAKTMASNTNNHRLIIEAKLCHGIILTLENKKLEAFRNFNVALHEGKLLEDKSVINKSAFHLAEFYISAGNLNNAEQLVQSQLLAITASEPVDSFEYMRFLRIAAQIYFRQKNVPAEHQASQLVLDYAIGNNLSKLKQDILTQIRSNAFETNDFNRIKEIYCNRYPYLLAELANRDSLAYLKIKSIIAETNNHMDSASYFLTLAQPLSNSKSLFFKANFYKRLGEFYLRQQKPKEALPHFLTAFGHAQQASHYAWCKENALVIEQIYQQQGIFQEAYKFSKHVQNYEDSLHKTNDVNQQLKLELENEASYSQKLEDRKNELLQKKKSLQTTAVVIIILLLFLILSILSSIQMPRALIKGVGFISFIFFFEFLILLADEKIHHITHGEPLKIMGIKLVLISFLLPLHHWVEHKVVHYLSEHRLIEPKKMRNLWSNIKLKFKEIYASDKHA